jgi:hypothetical protein
VSNKFNLSLSSKILIKKIREYTEAGIILQHMYLFDMILDIENKNYKRKIK